MKSHQALIVKFLRIGPEGEYILNAFIHQLTRSAGRAPSQQFRQPGRAIFCSVMAQRFGEPISVDDQTVSRRELKSGGGELLIAEQSNGNSGAVNRSHRTGRDMQRSQMTAVRKLDLATFACTTADESC